MALLNFIKKVKKQVKINHLISKRETSDTFEQEDDQMKYYKVKAKCGHVGRNYYILKAFYTEAESRKEAARLVRNLPRVKHNRKDAIREVFEITKEDYAKGRKITTNDPYFHVHCKQEQKLLCPNISECVIREEEKRVSRKRGNFRHIKDEALVKEKINEIKKGTYLYE